MAAHTIQPEHVLSQVEDLNKIGREEESLELIHDYISNKRGKVWSHALESLMHEKHSLIKEGLAAYRNITQSVNVSSLSAILKYYRREVEGLFERSIKDVANPNEFLMEIEEEDNPEDMLLNTLDNKFNKTKEEVSKKWKLLMEAYRTELELIYKNRKLEELYADVAMIGLTKCKKYNRKGEFKRLSEMIRMHQLNNVKAIEKIGTNLNHSAFALNLKAPETNQRLITLRFKQLELAKELKLWQDAYKIMEDINTLMRFRKKSNVDDFFMYFQSLSQVFWNSNHYHLHAVSLHSYVAYLRKRNEEAKTIAENVNYLILAAISIPKGTQTEENVNNEFFRRNCSLINSAGQIMSRDQLLANLRTGLYLELCSPEVKSIFQLITDCKDILQYSREVEKTFNQLKQSPTFQKYLPLIEHNIIASLVEKMSGLYKSLSFSTFRKLLGFLDFAKCEKFLLYSQTAGGVDVQIDYQKDMILFGHDGSYGDKVSANLVNLANNLCIAEKNLARLKMQESNEMNQLKSQCLSNARHYIEKAEEDLRNKREESQKLVAQKTNPIMLQRDEIARKRQLEEEQRRREQLKLQEQLVNEQRKLNIVIQRARNVILLDKNATLKGKRLDAFSEVDYQGVTIEDLKDVEEFIKNKKAKAEEDRIEKQFKNRDYLEREYRKKRNQMIKEEAEKANVNFEELHKEAQEKHKRRLELKQQFINIRSFVEDFKAKTQETRIKKFEGEIEKYRSTVTLAVAEKLVQKATELKAADDEAKKTESENQKIIDQTPVRPQAHMPVFGVTPENKNKSGLLTNLAGACLY